MKEAPQAIAPEAEEKLSGESGTHSPANEVTGAEKADTEQAGTTPPASRPPGGAARRMAERTWWLPWVLGAAVVTVGISTLVPLFTSDEDDWPDIPLPRTTYTVVYEITGAGTSPEIRYVVDGVNTTEKVETVALPWRKEFSVTVGPGVGIVQIAATNNGESDVPIACSVSVDGQVIRQQTAPGAFSTVSCSGAVYPKVK